jgi:putative ABC transport system ATP-binding protein
MNVLEAIDVTKTFREASQSVTVLRGASLSLDAGEIVALEGPSGSGKTTFLTILGCMLSPTSGRVNIEGPGADGDGERSMRPELEGLPGPGRAA